jgi:tRNA nucleotidyltransferase (CCA-adding enzyme)
LDQISLNQRLELELPPNIAELSPALSPETWPFSLEWLPDSACLVGGSVRDALLGRHCEYLDLDFVLPLGAVQTAQAIARRYKAGYVLLDPERQIARVVFPQGTADFAEQVGTTLEADLKRRDFTVNAIAYNPHTDQILDPLGGYVDLQQRQLRMVSAENLQEDPLRLLRAYRQAAQLGFSVESATRSVICQLAPLLGRIAPERVQSELNYLLSTAKGTPWLMTAWQDGILQDWLPSVTEDNLKLLAGIDQTAAVLEETLPAFAEEVCDRLRNSPKPFRAKTPALDSTPATTESKGSGTVRTWYTLAKLTSLLSPTPADAEAQLRRLKYSRTEIQAASTVLRFLPQLCTAAGISTAAPSQKGSAPLALSAREQFLFFQNVGAAFPAVAVMAIAEGVSLEAITPLIQHFLTPDDPIAHPTPLLTGQDLMNALNLSPGPHIGRLLTEIQLARAEAAIQTSEEALQLATEVLKTMRDER